MKTRTGNATNQSNEETDGRRQPRTRKSPRILVACALAAGLAAIGSATAAAPAIPSEAIGWGCPVGGGILHAGLVGAYYGDDHFGREVFTRRDLRIDFDWGTLLRPGGGLPWTREGSIGTEHYSIRWTGQLMPRFSEPYTFRAEADNVRIWIKPADQPEFPAQPQLDFWPAQDPTDYQPQQCVIALTAGQPYDLRLEYRQRTGPARMRLEWSSPSTPREVIQPTAIIGQIPPRANLLLADCLAAGVQWDSVVKGQSLTFDAEGWPASDFTFSVRPAGGPGSYLLCFTGSAQVRLSRADAEFFSADGTERFGSAKTPEQGYDPSRNRTLVRVVIAAGATTGSPEFTETRRAGPAGPANTGVTNLRLLRPLSPGGATPHDADEYFARAALRTLERFVTFRWNDVNGDRETGPMEWSERTLLRPNAKGRGVNHEYKILLNNRTGRDLYLQIPHRATDDYLRRLARLVRYGSDAAGEPYAAPVANPDHPPLNPNLRIYLEYSNELPWNSAGQYPQSAWLRHEPERLRQAGLADPHSPAGRRFAILNYDGALGNGSAEGMLGGKRLLALRIKEISDLFREVFGDEAMPAPGRADPRVRPVLMWQYNNANNTARDPLVFLDNYFNKTDPASTYPGPARPITDYLYGGGAATYYASADRHGVVADHPLTAQGLGTFESPVLRDGEAVVAPTGTPWTFTGTAGIYRQAARAEGKLGAGGELTKEVDDHDMRGFKFTVGDRDVAVYEVARGVHPRNRGRHPIRIYSAADNEQVFSMPLTLSQYKAGALAWVRTGYVNAMAAGKFFSHPIILQAKQSYYLVMQEFDDGDPHATAVEIQPPPGITINGAVKGRVTDGAAHWVVGDTPNRTDGPVNLRVAVAPVQTAPGAAGQPFTLGFVQDSKNGILRSSSLDQTQFSPQALFLAGNGTAELEIAFPAPGAYGLIYHLAHKRDQTPHSPDYGRHTNPLAVWLVDGTEIRSISPFFQSMTPGGPSSYEGYWTKPQAGYDFFGSAPIVITDAARRYRIRFSGTSRSADAVVLIDNIALASAAQMTAGTIPSGGGFAAGAPDVSNWEQRVMSMYRYAQAFGLRAMSYEGGWYPGGDANKMPLQFYAAFFESAVRQGEINAMNAMSRAGLAVATDYTRDFALPDEDFTNPDAYARMQAWAEVNGRLPAEPANGQPVNSVLTAAHRSWDYQGPDGTLAAGGWLSWNVIAPQSGKYVFRVQTEGAGGQVELVLNEAETIITGPSGGTLETATGVFLTRGLHALRLKARGTGFTVREVAGALPGQPFGVAGLTATPSAGQIEATWPAVADAQGYHLYYRTRTTTAWTRANPDLIPAATQCFIVTGLANDTTYHLALTVVRRGVESAFSNLLTLSPTTEPQPQPKKGAKK